MSRRSLHLVTALLLCCGLALAAYFAEKINREQYESDERAKVQHGLTVLRDALEGNLTSDIQLVRGLIGVVALAPDLDQRQFNIAVAPLVDVEIVRPSRASSTATLEVRLPASMKIPPARASAAVSRTIPSPRRQSRRIMRNAGP